MRRVPSNYSSLHTSVLGNEVLSSNGETKLLSHPDGLAFDFQGRLYVCDRDNYAIRVIDLNDQQPKAKTFCDYLTAIGPVGDPQKFQPTCLAIDHSGNVFVTTGHAGTCVWRIRADGKMAWILAGPSIPEAGHVDGIGQHAKFIRPYGIAIDRAGENLYVSDPVDCCIRQIHIATTKVSTIASGFPFVAGIALCPNNEHLFFCEYENAVVHCLELGTTNLTQVYPPKPYSQQQTTNNNQPIKTIDHSGFSGMANSRSVNNRFRESTSRIHTPTNNHPFSFQSTQQTQQTQQQQQPFTLTQSQTPRQINPPANASASAARVDSKGSLPDLVPNLPHDELKNALAFLCDGSGKLFVANTGNRTISVIYPRSGSCYTLTGVSGYAGNVDGTQFTARFEDPRAIALDSRGNLYVTERNRIRVIHNSTAIPWVGRRLVCSAKSALRLIRLLCSHRKQQQPPPPPQHTQAGNSITRRLTRENIDHPNSKKRSLQRGNSSKSNSSSSSNSLNSLSSSSSVDSMILDTNNSTQPTTNFSMNLDLPPPIINNSASSFSFSNPSVLNNTTMTMVPPPLLVTGSTSWSSLSSSHSSGDLPFPSTTTTTTITANTTTVPNSAPTPSGWSKIWNFISGGSSESTTTTTNTTTNSTTTSTSSSFNFNNLNSSLNQINSNEISNSTSINSNNTNNNNPNSSNNSNTNNNNNNNNTIANVTLTSTKISAIRLSNLKAILHVMLADAPGHLLDDIVKFGEDRNSLGARTTFDKIIYKAIPSAEDHCT